MSKKFKVGAKYKGDLINGTQACKAVFEYVGYDYFKLLNMHPLLENYSINSRNLLCTEDEDDGGAFWDLKPYVTTLENK